MKERGWSWGGCRHYQQNQTFTKTSEGSDVDEDSKIKTAHIKTDCINIPASLAVMVGDINVPRFLDETAKLIVFKSNLQSWMTKRRDREIER